MPGKIGSLRNTLNNPEKARKFDEWSTEFYPHIPGGIWKSLETRGENQYVLWDTIPVTQQMCEQIRLAGNRIYKLIQAGLQYSLQADQLISNEYCFPGEYIALGLGDTVPIGDMRIDLSIKTQAYEDAINNAGKILPNDVKLIECNSATPSFMWESGSGQRLINEAFGRTCPNTVGRDWSLQMGQDFHQYVNEICKERNIDLSKIPLYFTYLGDEANNWIHEDNLSFYERMAQYEEASGNPVIFRFFQDLILDAEGTQKGIIDGQSENGDLIKLLFSHVCYNTLSMGDVNTIEHNSQFKDTSIPRPSLWDCFQKAILEQEVTKFPGTQATYAQSKAFYALLYESMLEGKFDDQITQIIKDHLLPTFCTPEFAHEYGMWLNQTIFEKPVYGNEGRGIYAYRTDTTNPEKFEMILDSYKENQETDKWYDDQFAIYQHQGDLPKYYYYDEDGKTINGELTLMFSVYISAKGESCLIGCRAHAQSELTAINPESGIWVPLSIQE